MSYTGKPGYLSLVDLTYTYDLAGNITAIQDGVRGETRSYVYDALDRLVEADVYSGQQMIEERYYTYDTIGNLLSFRHRFPSVAQGRGAFQTGGDMDGTSYGSRGSFDGLGSGDLSSQTYTGSAYSPYVYGFGGGAPSGGYNTRGSVGGCIKKRLAYAVSFPLAKL